MPLDYQVAYKLIRSELVYGELAQRIQTTYDSALQAYEADWIRDIMVRSARTRGLNDARAVTSRSLTGGNAV